MEILLDNLMWMAFNVFLAAIPVVFGRFMLKAVSIWLKSICALIWFIFLPNTIYLLTDIIHLFRDAQRISGIYLFIDIFCYLVLIVLGVYTFIISIISFEKLIFGSKSVQKIKQNMPIIYALNLFVGFGLVLGRFQRVNSWEVITDVEKVILGSLAIIRSEQLMILVAFFAILAQLVYSSFRKYIPKKSR